MEPAVPEPAFALDGRDNKDANLEGANLDDGSRPAAGAYAPPELRARLAEPDQEQALGDALAGDTGGFVAESQQRQRYSSARKDEAEAGKRGLRADDTVANVVSGADYAPEPTELEEKQLEKSVDKLEAKQAAKPQVAAEPPPPPARDVAAKSKAPPRSENAWSPGAAMERAQADEDDAEEAPMAQSVAGGKSASREPVYRNAKDDSWARSEQGKLNRALDAKKSKDERCRDAARIANNILDRNPDYYYAKVEGSKRLAPCNMYVSQERSRRSSDREKARAKGTKKAAPADTAASEAE
jgi:hypothetical protein